MDATVRVATAADMQAVGKLAALLVRDFHAFDPKRFIEPEPDTAEGYGGFLASQLSKRDVRVFVAEENGSIVGYTYVSLEGYDWMSLRGPAGVLHDIVVDPAHRCAGVGRALMDASLDWLRERGAPRVVLDTAWPNQVAQRLFEKSGFRRTMVEMTRELS